MHTIAFYSPKGGVGKTASAVNIAYLAAAAGYSVTLWDLDPQGAATWYLNQDQPSTKKIAQLLQNKIHISKVEKETAYENLTLIPADASCRDLDLLLEQSTNSKKRLKRIVKDTEKHLLIFDCPPTFSLTATNVFQASDYLFIPLIPTHLSLNAYQELLNVVSGKGYEHLHVHPFFSMVDRRRKLHNDIVSKPPKYLKGKLKATIPYSTHIEKMGDHRAPINCFADKSLGGLAYRVLWFEIKKKIKGLK